MIFKFGSRFTLNLPRIFGLTLVVLARTRAAGVIFLFLLTGRQSTDARPHQNKEGRRDEGQHQHNGLSLYGDISTGEWRNRAF